MITSVRAARLGQEERAPVAITGRARLLRVAALAGAWLALLSVAWYARATAALISPTDVALYFDQTHYAALVNSTFTVDLWVDGADHLAGWEARLDFDPAQLEVVQVTAGAFLGSSGRAVQILQSTPAAGQLMIGQYSYGEQAAVSGSGVLAQVTLRALTAGQSSLTLHDALLANMTGTLVQSSVPASTGEAQVELAAPLAVAIASLQATARREGVLVTWETVSEVDASGFRLYRAEQPDGPRQMMAFVPSQMPGSSQGAVYDWLDRTVVAGTSYHYWLEAVDLAGAATLHGPVSVVFVAPTAVTLAGAQTPIGQPPVLIWWIALAGLALLATGGVLAQKKP